MGWSVMEKLFSMLLVSERREETVEASRALGMSR